MQPQSINRLSASAPVSKDEGGAVLDLMLRDESQRSCAATLSTEADRRWGYRLVVPLGTAAVPCNSPAGLSQQAWTRELSVSVAFGSMLP